MVKNTFRFCLILAVLLQNAVAFSFGGNDQSKSISDTSVIATVGAYKITLKEFRESYEFGPSFVKEFKNPKLTHLQYMINEKLIALDGYANGIDTVGSISRMLKEVEDDIIVTEWYRQNIFPLAIVDSSLIKRGIEQSSVGLLFRYIFTDNEFELQDIKALLDNGCSFDSIYSLLKQDPKFFLDEVPTNFFTLFEDNPLVADKLALLKPGTCSDIINTKDGSYLVRLDNAKKDFIITPIEFKKMWADVEKYYAKKILDSLTIVYVRGVMEECPPTISGDALKKLFSFLSKTNIQSRFINKDEKIFNINFNSEVTLDEDPGGEILVRSKCDRFTVKDFVEWYSYRNTKIDFSKPTASTLNFIKDLLFKMVRDRRLIKIARNEGYANDPMVNLEVKEWRDKLAYWKQKSLAIKQPTFTEEEVQKFYAENNTKYGTGTTYNYEQAKDKVENDLLRHKYNKQLRYYLNSLNGKYPIKINEELLSSIRLSDENLSKKIDLFILKKGGTLPRQAFPTIDNEWLYY